MTVLEKAADDLAFQLAARKDAVLAALITERLGHSSWKLHAIAHRINASRVIPDQREIWQLDGEPLVVFYPLQVKPRSAGMTMMMDATLRHRKLPRGLTIAEALKVSVDPEVGA